MDYLNILRYYENFDHNQLFTVFRVKRQRRFKSFFPFAHRGARCTRRECNFASAIATAETFSDTLFAVKSRRLSHPCARTMWPNHRILNPMTDDASSGTRAVNMCALLKDALLSNARLNDLNFSII